MENNISADYSIQKGMKISELREQLNKTGVPKETEEMLFNFCDNDIDQTISDDIELAIVNAWQAGESKVKMPDIKSNDNVFCQILAGIKSIFNSEYSITSNNKNDSSHEINVASNRRQNSNISTIIDNNDDGYADIYNGAYMSISDDGMSVNIKEVNIPLNNTD